MGTSLLLLEAAYAYRANSEDRLTEIPATALHAHPGSCRRLVEELGLPAGERYVVTTQHRISPGYVDGGIIQQSEHPHPTLAPGSNGQPRSR